MGLTKRDGSVTSDSPYVLGATLLKVGGVAYDGNRVIINCGGVSFPIVVKNALVKSKDGLKTLFINEKGNTYYAKSITDVPDFLRTEQMRPSFMGEAKLVNLIINANDMDSGDIDFMISPKRLLVEGDITEVRSFLIDTSFVAWGTLYNGEQSTFYEFLPADTYPQFKEGEPQTDRVKEWLKRINK